MSIWLKIFVLGLLLINPAEAEVKTFRLHVLTEPASLKPWEQKNSNGLYFLGQVFGTLLKFRDHRLQGSLAKTCTFVKPQKILCELEKDSSFSDGSPVTAQDFVRSFELFLKPENRAFRADLLFSVKNAEKYFRGEIPFEKVGLRAIQTNKLEIVLQDEDPEFLYNLTSPLLTALKVPSTPNVNEKTELITSGAYRLKSWEPRRKIVLEHRKRPDIHVEFLFVSEDSVALNLYEKNELQFLRRLPTLYIPKYRNRPDYHAVDQIRFDYIGFGPALKAWPELRKALALGLDYSELTRLLWSKGSFGCPGLAADLYPNGQSPCLRFDLESAKKALTKISTQRLPPLIFQSSKQGGDDVSRILEWMVNQWNTNLHIDVQLQTLDNKLFVDNLRTNTPTIFRKGLSPERPTCLSAMEVFSSSSSENYLRIESQDFKKLLKTLKSSAKTEDSRQKACEKITQYLLNEFLLIPSGPTYFSILAKPEWSGWHLNELNLLDLSDLKYKN